MENNKIVQEFEKGFNRSSKIMEYKIGIDAARLLNTLIYKHNYWIDEDRMVKLEEGEAFWITIPNLQGETNMKPFTIKKAIKNLEKLKLIEVYRRGVPSKNHYILNREAILGFDDRYKNEYEDWLNKLYVKAVEDRSRFPEQSNKISDEEEALLKKNTSAALIVPQSAEKSPTSEIDSTPLVSEYSTVTNNKSTKNKITYNTTNRINAVEDEIDLYDYSDELTEAILALQAAISGDLKPHSKLYDLLIKITPAFKSFEESSRDSNMIDKICNYSIDAYDIAFKILSNAKAIKEGRKSSRFGNLFVGLEEKNANMEKLMFH